MSDATRRDEYPATQQGEPVEKIDRGQVQPDERVRPVAPDPDRGQVEPGGKPGAGEDVKPVSEKP
jgi:hypothetical protein